MNDHEPYGNTPRGLAETNERLEAELERLRAANERLEAALAHIINRVSTEHRDDEHKLLFLVGEQAILHVRREVSGESQVKRDA